MTHQMRSRFEREVLLLLFPANPSVPVVRELIGRVSVVVEVEEGGGGWALVGVNSGLLLLVLPDDALWEEVWPEPVVSCDW